MHFWLLDHHQQSLPVRPVRHAPAAPSKRTVDPARLPRPTRRGELLGKVFLDLRRRAVGLGDGLGRPLVRAAVAAVRAEEDAGRWRERGQGVAPPRGRSGTRRAGTGVAQAQHDSDVGRGVGLLVDAQRQGRALGGPAVCAAGRLRRARSSSPLARPYWRPSSRSASSRSVALLSIVGPRFALIPAVACPSRVGALACCALSECDGDGHRKGAASKRPYTIRPAAPLHLWEYQGVRVTPAAPSAPGPAGPRPSPAWRRRGRDRGPRRRPPP